MDDLRASVIVRCSQEDAGRIRNEACAEHRSVSGYLLHVLEFSFRIEDKVPPAALLAQGRSIKFHVRKSFRTALHLHCTAEEAARIRRYAAGRKLSLSDFVVFSLWRMWKARDRLHGEVRNSRRLT